MSNCSITDIFEIFVDNRCTIAIHLVIKTSFKPCLWTNLSHVRVRHGFRRWFLPRPLILCPHSSSFRFFNSFAPFLLKSFRKEPRSENETRLQKCSLQLLLRQRAYWIKFLMLKTIISFFPLILIYFPNFFSIWRSEILHSNILFYFHEFFVKN